MWKVKNVRKRLQKETNIFFCWAKIIEDSEIQKDRTVKFILIIPSRSYFLLDFYE